MIEYVVGDAVQALKAGSINVLVHGCNCFCTMGAGIAKQIAKDFPEILEMDRCTEYGDVNKLGTIQYLATDGIGGTKFIINAYTQYHYSREGELLDYDALRLCMRKIGKIPAFTRATIGMPKIGCGLAGGDWDRVSKIINEELKNHTVKVYTL